MRGKAFPLKFVCLEIRITPAYAGKRLLEYLCRRDNQDHPRLCGEKAMDGIDGKTSGGSPPPMRGKVRRGTA